MVCHHLEAGDRLYQPTTDHTKQFYHKKVLCITRMNGLSPFCKVCHQYIYDLSSECATVTVISRYYVTKMYGQSPVCMVCHR